MNVDENSMANSQLVKETFRYWFEGNDHIRSPFPDYIRTELKRKVIGRFTEWLNKLKDDTRESLNDTIIQEKFEEILFETGIGLVKTEDEKITIRYPFLPRIGDVIQDKESDQVHSGEGEVTSRYIVREKDKKFLRIKVSDSKYSKEWETGFELPPS